MVLTAERWRSMVDLDPETGIFTWKRRPVTSKATTAWNNQWAGKRVRVSVYADPQTPGRKCKLIKITGRSYSVPRLVWLHVNGRWPIEEVDHKDGDWSNDSASNLRECTHSQNQMNKGPMRNNKLGIKGVGYREERLGRKKFYAQIKIPGTKITKHLGWHATAEEAAHAYREVARQLHGEFFRA